MPPFTVEEKLAYCLKLGIAPENHCCVEMAYSISHPIEIEHQGPNRVLDWVPSWNEYRIPVANDGYSSTLIQFCPFCGSKLPLSQRELWYKTLYSLGFSDPGEEEIPNEFNTDKWWRNAHR